MRLELPATRSPSLLVRIAASIGALIVLGVLVVFGMFALAILAVLGLAWLVWFRWKLHKVRRAANDGAAADSNRNTDPDVIEGEYVVVHENRDSTP